MQLTALHPKAWWQTTILKHLFMVSEFLFLFFIPFIIYDKGYFLLR